MIEDAYTMAVRDLYALLRLRPRPLHKMFGHSPTEEQKLMHAELVRDWQRKERGVRRRMRAAKGV